MSQITCSRLTPLPRLVDFIQYSQGSILSKDGKCKPFDAAADGYAFFLLCEIGSKILSSLVFPEEKA